MFDYLEKFNNLSSELKSAVSSPEVVRQIDELEKKYQIDLAAFIMRIMIKEININNLPLILFTEFGLNKDEIKGLTEELKNKVFFQVLDYLGIKSEPEIEKIEDEIIDDEIEELNLSVNQEILENYQKNEYGYKIKNWANEIIKILNLKFVDEDKKNKFISTLEKYLRGIKSRYSVREIFTTNKDSGGFGLADKMVDNIFMIAQKIREKENQEIKNNFKIEDDVLSRINKLGHGKISSKIEPLMLPAEDFSYELPSPDRELSEESSELPVIVPKKEKSIIEKKELPIIKEETIKKMTESFSVPKKEINTAQKNSNISFNKNGKVQMTDVRRIKITGPIDELKYMDLVNFRRLSSNPTEAFKRIAQKLRVLEEIDYGKMLEGIKAWRQSPVNKLYLKIFFRASNEAIDINQVIEDLKTSGQDYLTKEEIEALIKFNKGLVF
jgi:glycerol-3-phosphate cytidylyltransferase-like family protein